MSFSAPPDADHAPADFQSDPAAEAFYSGAERRALLFLLALAVLGTIALWAAYGGWLAAGFLLGSAASVVNFFWLKRAVAGFTAAIVSEANRPSGARLVFRYLVRFALITFAAFAIFKSSRTSGYGFLAGLFLPVAALMCEAAYETWVAVRRKL